MRSKQGIGWFGLDSVGSDSSGTCVLRVTMRRAPDYMPVPVLVHFVLTGRDVIYVVDLIRFWFG